MEKKNTEIGFILNQIKTDQFAVFEENYKETETIQLTTLMNYGLDSETKVFVVIPKFTFEINEKPFMTIQVSCYFEINPAAWDRFISNGKTIIPKGFICHTAMHAVGTARGILHCKTEDTLFNKFILPPINVDAMIPDDVVFD